MMFYYKSKRIKHKAGFTLIELVIVLALTGILVAAIAPFVATNVDAFVRIRGAKQLAQGARIGLNRMAEEIRMATNLRSGYSDRLQFDFRDSNGNMHTYVDYRFQQNALTRDDVALVPLVQSYSIKYYKGDGTQFTPGTTTIDVRRIQIEMTIGSSGILATVRTQVAPRNIIL